MTIQVTGYQWAWKFQYPGPNYTTSIGELNLPENTIVLFNVTSTDVYHNFYLQEFRTSIDAIPGRYNSIWIKTPPLGGNSVLYYHIVCKELCGTGHTYMVAHMNVLSQAAYDQWIANQTNFQTQSGGMTG
jgi:cytochrome c oxidase subunit II